MDPPDPEELRRNLSLLEAETALRADLCRLEPWMDWWNACTSPRILDLAALAEASVVARLVHVMLGQADRAGASHVRFWVDHPEPTVDGLVCNRWIQQMTIPLKLVLPLTWCLKAICRIPVGPQTLSWTSDVTMKLAGVQTRRVVVHFLREPAATIAELAEEEPVHPLPEDPTQRAELERASRAHDDAQRALDEGECDVARALCSKADRICESLGASGARPRINTLLLLADATEDPLQRQQISERVNRLVEDLHGARSRQAIESQELLASCALKRNRFDQAAHRYHDLRELITELLGPQALELLTTYQGLRYCAVQQGCVAEADQWAERKRALERWWARPAQA